MSVADRMHNVVKHEKNKAVLQNNDARKNNLKKNHPGPAMGEPWVKISGYCGLSKDRGKTG